MSLSFSKRTYFLLAFILIIGGGYFANKSLNPKEPTWITTTVELGTVQEMVSVSGFVEAKQLAELAFPSAGTVTSVMVEEGDDVLAGDILATLAATQLVAERAEAVSNLKAAEANYEKVSNGPRDETLAVANTNLKNAETNLARITAEENKKIDNARKNLLSAGLTANTEKPDEATTPPVVSGTYSCSEEGTYLLKVYSSASDSGYSYTYTGIESSGTGVVSTDQPTPLGTCGLYLQFTAGDRYQGSQWSIEIPNPRNENYTTLKNTYELVKTQAENAIKQATDALTLAQDQNSLSIAPARNEEIREALALVEQAKARVATVDTKISDRSIVAPFSGTITEVNITNGESAGTSPVITLLADNAFSLRARVPEIDITKIALDQKVESIFDAKSDEKLIGTISYISPIATQIDGVAYFETIINLDESPSWLRAGLNADVDIITKSKEEVLRLPKRFVSTRPDGSKSVLTLEDNKTATTTIEVVFTGNDSYVEVAGLTAGTVVIAP